MQLNKVIKKPIITEKSLNLQDEGVYIFAVNVKSSKSAIKDEVEKLFDVNVESVKTMIIPGKKKRVLKTRRFTKTPKWKKAVVKVASGQKIKLFGEGK